MAKAIALGLSYLLALSPLTAAVLPVGQHLETTIPFSVKSTAPSSPEKTYSRMKSETHTKAQETIENSFAAQQPIAPGGDCGPRVIQKFLKQELSKDVSLSLLVQQTKTVRGQTNMEGLKNGLREYGFKAQGVKTNMEGLSQILKNNRSFIAHVGGNRHYAWIYKVGEVWVEGYNPAVNNEHWKLPRETFQSIWKGEGLLIAKGDDQLIIPSTLKGVVEKLTALRERQIWGGSICYNTDGNGGLSSYSDSGIATSQPVELSNGNFFPHETDFNIPALGPALTLSRIYNVQLFSDIEGWNPDTGTGSWSVMDGKYAGAGDRSLTTDNYTNFDMTLTMQTIQPGTSYDWEAAWVNFRFLDEDHNRYFFLIHQSGDLELVKYKDGNSSDLFYKKQWGTPAQYDPLQPHTVRIKAVDAHIQIWVDGNAEVDVTDSDPLLTPGKIALESYFSNCRYDDISITDLNSNQTKTWNFNSDDNQGMFGRGWRSNIETSLVFYSNGDIFVRKGNDSRTKFTWNSSSSTWSAPSGNYEVLTQTSQGYDMREKDGTVFHFNTSGLLTSISDRNANTLSFSYTTVAGKQRVSQMTDTTGRSINFTYNTTTGLCTQATDPLGRTVAYGYQEIQLGPSTYVHILNSVTDKRGHSCQYAYDSLYRMTQYTNRNGNSIQNQYAYNNRIIAQKDPEGNTTALFDYLWNVTQVTDGNGKVRTYEFAVKDGASYLARATDAEGNAIHYDWGSDHRLHSVTDPRGNLTSFTYDDMGNTLSKTDPRGQTESWTYEPVYNQVTSYTDKMGNTTIYSYDSNGNQIASQDPLVHIESMTYNSYGQVLTKTDKRGYTTSITYDSYGYPKTITDPLGGGTELTADAGGRVTQVKNALNNTIKIDYDANDNVVRMTDPILHVSTQEYDANDNKTKVIDPLNHSISYTYNAFDQVQTINDPLGNVTTSYYDKSRYLLDRALNLTSVKDPAGYITQFGYDGIGRKLQAANALNYITQYQYDSAGDLLKVIDASSHTTSYQYDQLSRSTAAIFPDGSKEMKIYDANGNIQQEILRDGRSISYQYNKLNQKIERRVNGNLDLDGRLSGSQNTWTMQGSWADFSLSVFMQTLVPGTQSWHSGWIRFRYQDDNNQYFFLIHNSGVLELSRIVGGTKTILSMVTSSYNPSNFNQLSIQADKGVIKVWVNNQLVMNQIDSSPLLSAGQVILEAQAAEVRFANLQVLDIAHDTVQSWDQTVIYGRDIDGNMMETVTSGNGQTSRLVSEPGQWKLSDGGDWKNFLMSANIQTSSAGANAWNTSWVRFRFKDWDNHYYVLLSTSGQLELSKYKGGQKTFLQAKATAYSPFDSHKFQVEARGSFMQVWVDNNLEISYADSDPILDAGQLILESNYAECHFQSMSVADLGDSYSDVQLSFDVQTISSGAASWDTAWMNFRYQDDNNRYYFLMHTTGLMELGRFVGGNKTILAQQSSSYSPLDLHRLEIEALGDKLKVFVDKTLAFDVTDSTPLLLAGGLVIQGNNSQARYENLKIVNPNQQYGDFLLNTLIQTMGTGSQTYHTAFINFRYQDDDNRYYFLIHTTGELELSRVKNGVKTILTTKSSSYSPLDPHNVQIQATGGRIQIMVDGTPAIDWVDSDPILSAGKLALKSDSTVPVYYELNEYKKIFSQDWDEFVAYDYDMNGNIVKVSRNGTESWSNVYDPLNRLTQTTDSFGNSIYYQYDALGRRIQMTYPDGLVITYGYNANNQLAEVREGTSTVLVSYAYDNAGRMITKTLGNGVVSNYTYDNANRLTDLVTSKGGTTLASYSYSYDSRGNRITKSALFGSHTYAYDSINQLTQAIEPNSGQKDYTYDPVNNRATLDESIGLSSYSINSLNQIVQVNNSSGTTNLTWDLKGNLATNINAFSSATYRHDIFNQLLEVKRTGQSMTSFSYDVSNRRIGKSANGVTLQYSWDGNDLVEVRDSSGTVLKKFVYGGGIDAPILMRTDNGDYYYSMDGLGSISELTDASGTLVESYRYDANGNTKLYDDSSNQIAESSIGNPFFYTAREYDFETKLYYYRARYYDPKMGVFLETDPMGYQQGMNLYSYVHNNPLTGTDPMGLADVYITIGGSSGDGNPGSSFPWYDPYNLGPDGVRDVYGEINDISGHGSGIANSNGYHLTEDIFRRGAEESEKRRIQDETAFQRSISAMHDHIEDQRTQNSFVRAGQAFFNTLGNEIGFPNMVTQPEDLAPAGLEAGAMYYSGRAIQHAARRGLSYPNKSIIFQGFMRKSVMLGEASAMVAAFEAGFAIGKGLNAAVDAYNEK